MNKKKVLILAFFIIVVVLIVINAYVFKFNKYNNLKEVDEVITTDSFEISINDYYEADYTILDSSTNNFDKYLAVDLNIKNISDEKQKFFTIGHFLIDDGSYNLKNVVIDENHKKFSKELYPNETFEITLTFPVDNANEYILYYDKTFKAKDEKKLGFKLNGLNLEKKEVEKTLEHLNPLEGTDEEGGN